MSRSEYELEDIANAHEQNFFNINSNERRVSNGKENGNNYESSDDDQSDNVAIDIDDAADMKVMKQAVHVYNEDKYLASGNITALIELDEHEKEDDALILTMKNIHKTYLLGVEGVPALRGVSLSVRRGEFLVIFGTSGGGKTSLLNIIGTIDKPTKGSMKIAGTRISKSTTDTELSELRRNKLGFVFQTFNLLSSLNALENVMLPMILAGKYTREERIRRAKDLLRRVGMGKRFNHVPSQLSGGEQQRVTIARSIANEPDILLLDEPTGDLDTVNSMIVMKLLTDLHQNEGLTLVMVTHELHLKNFADRVVWMRDGKIQNVETVDKRKRKEAYKQLNEACERMEIDKKILGEEEEDDEIIEESWYTKFLPSFLVGKKSMPPVNRFETRNELDTGSSSFQKEDTDNEGSSITFEVTSVRKPVDYITHSALITEQSTSKSRSEDQKSRASPPSSKKLEVRKGKEKVPEGDLLPSLKNEGAVRTTSLLDDPTGTDSII
eukprot:TRINITY_DN10170_c0_g3_i1.p1 TRINITY_DN10170_c0_g3~~TRINITY_DN10170_c0_g3_i1.p1  ORF type:complete len:496 (+),score=121.10 TRINITY_DN10170_c0_g3_i1:99-1586(+)